MLVLIVISISLILIIHNSFAVSMNARIYQFDIFSSIGAAPMQIRICLIQEALALCLIPIFAGIFIGIAFLSSFLTVLFSAYIPARKLSKVTPLEAIRHTNVLQLKKKRHSRILSVLFGIEGELAGNALWAQKKALRTSTLSLTLSFLVFTVMVCFFTLSGISTNYTYFERYKDVWDVMVTIKDTNIEEFDMTEELKELSGVKGSTVYQKVMAVSPISDDLISDELRSLGGLKTIAGTTITDADGIRWIYANYRSFLCVTCGYRCCQCILKHT